MQVRKTQNAIKHALTERFYAWEDAVKLAKEDPEIEFKENGELEYTPGGMYQEQEPVYMEEDLEDDMFVEEEDGEDVKADHTVIHEAVDPSIPQGPEKTKQDGPRP